VPSTRIKPRRAVALLLFGTITAGCGSYTKRDFLTSANAICASTLRQTRNIPPPSFTTSPTQQHQALAAYLAQLLPVVRSEAHQLGALRRPPGTAAEQAMLARYLQAVRQTVTDYATLAAAAQQDDAQGITSAEATLRSSPVAALAAGYGLTSCGIAPATYR
jgi:hypothetical protein